MKISICIATYKRPEGLKKLLKSLGELVFAENHPARIDIVVADNNVEGSAREVCASFAERSPYAVHYVAEPQRGISRARNCALKEASRLGADLLAFIDDDEVPSPDWLDILLTAMKINHADAVIGRVIPSYEEPPQPWVSKVGFFERRRWASGETVTSGYTGNLLADRTIFDNLGGFDPYFDLSGGGDSHFFLRARWHGFRIVYCDEAVVYESVHPGRTNAKWLIQRFFRMGNAWALCNLRFSPYPEIKLILMMKGLMIAALGTAFLPAGILGKEHTVRALILIARGLGLITGVMGAKYEEYQ